MNRRYGTEVEQAHSPACNRQMGNGIEQSWIDKSQGIDDYNSRCYISYSYFLADVLGNSSTSSYHLVTIFFQLDGIGGPVVHSIPKFWPTGNRARKVGNMSFQIAR